MPTPTFTIDGVDRRGEEKLPQSLRGPGCDNHIDNLISVLLNTFPGKSNRLKL